jgi:ribosomal protein L12E/L44/L45/RPP1/RPP2
MLKPTIHLCLVHNTATANVTPALDPDFRPQEVILLHSADQEYRAHCLESVLKPTGIKVSRWSIQDTREVEHIRDRVLELMIEREHEDIALNATGGTRPMSIAAYEIFKEFGKPIFYVHPETDYVSWMHQRDLPSFNVADRIKLPAFLQAHGAEVGNQGERRGVPENLRRLTQELINHAESLAKPLRHSIG